MNKDVLLSGKSLKKAFGSNTVLHDVDIELYSEDFTVIMGASGSGKSTLLYTLSGMDTVSGGHLQYNGRDITHISESEMTKLRADDFGFVFQRSHLVSNLSLYENIVLAGYVGSSLSEAESKKRADELISKMNLFEAKDRLPGEVSGGEAQRAAVARAVMKELKILFADEPTGSLNKSNTHEVLDLLSNLHAEGQAVLLVTHDPEAAARGNRILYLEDGAITGELKLPPYQGKDPQREETLSSWLEGLRW